jgi:hypothetical protein
LPSKSVRASTTTVAAVAPFFSAVRYVNILKDEPGCRTPMPATSNWPWTRGSSRSL